MHDEHAVTVGAFDRLLRRRFVPCPIPCLDAGIATVEGLVYATTKELGAIKGISEQKVTKLKEIGGCCNLVLAWLSVA